MSMTQHQFAVRFGSSTATLRHWESGDCAPRALVPSDMGALMANAAEAN